MYKSCDAGALATESHRTCSLLVSPLHSLEHLKLPCVWARQEMPRVTVANAPLCLHSSLRARGDELW
eukprot:s212_g2.t1